MTRGQHVICQSLADRHRRSLQTWRTEDAVENYAQKNLRSNKSFIINELIIKMTMDFLCI